MPKPATKKKAVQSEPGWKSRPTTVAGYLESLAPETRALIAATRKLVRANIPKGYAEFMNWGVINWGIPLSEFSNTYNGQPLCYVALGAQKNYSSLYLMGCYGLGFPPCHGFAPQSTAGKEPDNTLGEQRLRSAGVVAVPPRSIRLLFGR